MNDDKGRSRSMYTADTHSHIYVYTTGCMEEDNTRGHIRRERKFRRRRRTLVPAGVTPTDQVYTFILCIYIYTS